LMDSFSCFSSWKNLHCIQTRMQIVVAVPVAYGSEFGHNPKWDPKTRWIGLGFGRFSSTWRQLNLNFLDVGFSLRCKSSKTIHKPSPMALGLLRSGGSSNWPMCESASFKNWRGGEMYGTKIPTWIPPEFAT
jgi:hypothetical protein